VARRRCVSGNEVREDEVEWQNMEDREGEGSNEVVIIVVGKKGNGIDIIAVEIGIVLPFH